MPFDLQPTLAGDLLTLRPLAPDDFAAIYAVAADPLIWEQHPANDRYKEDVFRELFRESLESGGALIAIDNRTGQVIGWSRYAACDQDRSEIEIGWSFLARSHWGGVYNGEMKQLMLRVPVRRERRLSRRAAELPVAASDGEDRRHPRRHANRRQRAHQSRVPHEGVRAATATRRSSPAGRAAEPDIRRQVVTPSRPDDAFA